jgi:hypothetical protein
MDMNSFSKFAGKAGIFPRILNEPDLESVYKEQISTSKNIGMNFTDFKRCLALLVIKMK